MAIGRGGTLLTGLLGPTENSVGGLVLSSEESIMILRKLTRAFNLKRGRVSEQLNRRWLLAYVASMELL